MKTSLFPRRARSRTFAFALLATPSLALVPTTSHAFAATCGATYTVRPGDSLWSIGQACGISPDTIRQLNLSRLKTYLQPGQVLSLGAPAQSVPVATTTSPATGAATGSAYTVQPGDTLSGIALRLGIAQDTLAALNGLSNPNALKVGQVLRLAGSMAPQSTTASASTTSATATYTVKPGDTLWDIAAAQGVTPSVLAQANGISNARSLRVGAVLRIPSPTGSASAPSPGTTFTPANTTLINSGTYTVKPGDNLWTIAQNLGLTPASLAQTSGIALNASLQPGQILRYAVVTYTGPSLATVGTVLDQQSAQVGVENALLKAIAFRESSWRMVDAADGGIGVMQLMPDTVKWLQATYVPGNWDPHNLVDNIHAGAVLLLVYSRAYNNDLASIAEAYHGGPGAVSPSMTKEMQNYVDAVVGFRQAFLGGGFPQ